MALYEALYGRKCRTPIHRDEVDERSDLGSEIVQKTVDVVVKIRDRMKTVQSRQKSYADKRRRDLEFAVGDHVFLSPNLSYEEKPIQILDRQERRIRNKVTKLVKVKWLNHSDEEVTWETEADMRSRNPELFDKP
ncbi:uncharacterized protein [Primulina huaijiensis]|uniref:uncharacterized protein n=1 Tax=Primulina huaijiensis TaxID=1492673 RepID=UPI003CC73BD9